MWSPPANWPWPFPLASGGFSALIPEVRQYFRDHPAAPCVFTEGPAHSAGLELAAKLRQRELTNPNSRPEGPENHDKTPTPNTGAATTAAGGRVPGLTIFPFAVSFAGEYAALMARGQEAIETLSPNYEPGFEPLASCPSRRSESLLFPARPALGSRCDRYVIGLYRGRSEGQEPERFVPSPRAPSKG